MYQQYDHVNYRSYNKQRNLGFAHNSKARQLEGLELFLLPAYFLSLSKPYQPEFK